MIHRRPFRLPDALRDAFRGAGALLFCSLAVLVGGELCGALPAQAQRSGQNIKQFEGVKLDQRLGETVPGDITFRTAEGKMVRLDRYFDGKRPVILNLVYHECPQLCNLALQGLTSTMKKMEWTPGEEFEVLTVSFNYREGPEVAREEKEMALGNLGKPEAANGWHFLTGSEKQVQRLTSAVGFHFNWVEEQQEFAHPSAVIFLSGERKITRYIPKLDPGPGDTRKALVEASDGQVGNVVDQIVFRCFQYDPNSNSYVADAFNIMRLGSLLFAALLGVVLVVFWRRESSRQGEAPEDASDAKDDPWGPDWKGAHEET